MQFNLYKKANCPQCNATRRGINKEAARAGLTAYWSDTEYDSPEDEQIARQSADVIINSIDVEQDDTAYAHLSNAGYRQAPVVELIDDKNDNTIEAEWSGYRPDMIKRSMARLAALASSLVKAQ